MSSSLSPNDIEAVRQLMKLVADNGLSELSITLREGLSVTIKSELNAPAPTQYMLPYADRPTPTLQLSQPGSAPSAQIAAAPSSPKAHKGTPVASPATGIFYYSPSPGDPPYVKVGDTVKIGQVIGLLEAMKVFSDVHADIAGKVTELAAGDGQLVRDGEPLIFVS